MNVDIKTLEILIETMRRDMKGGTHGLNRAAVMSIAGIIEAAIGAPLMWPSRIAGAEAAADYYPGSPDGRQAFNAGVKWTVEHYGATNVISHRFAE